MSIKSCPYCGLKSIAETKCECIAKEPKDGVCPDCGAYIDVGQHSVKINSYADIYKGAIALIDMVAGQFSELLQSVDSDEFSKYDIKLKIPTSKIIETLFVPNYGMTTKDNVAKALGIKEYSHTWVLTDDEDEEE